MDLGVYSCVPGGQNPELLMWMWKTGRCVCVCFSYDFGESPSTFYSSHGDGNLTSVSPQGLFNFCNVDHCSCQAKRETAYGEKPEAVKTHLRNMVIVRLGLPLWPERCACSLLAPL